LSLFVVIKKVKGSSPNKLAFLAHGYNDVHDSAHMRAITAPLLRSGYLVVLWDATNSRGRSEGSMRQVSMTSYLHDCEDVIAWAKSQNWFVSPYLLGGHSMGGATAGLVAARQPEEVERLLLLAPLVSGWRVSKRVSPLFRLLYRYTAERRAAQVAPSWFTWELMRDLRRYDLISVSHRLTMPTLIIVGQLDPLTTVGDQKFLLETLAQGELKIVPLGTHNFSKSAARELVTEVTEKWLA
jgi:pimeloyl-ACP methyl ester carboxylesterase